MYKIFTLASIILALTNQTFASDSCIVLSSSTSSKNTEKGVVVELTYSTHFESDIGAKNCLKDISGSLEQVCENFGYYSGSQRVGSKKVNITLLNRKKGWENSRVILKGECKESETTHYINGQFQKRLQFQSNELPTVERTLD